MGYITANLKPSEFQCECCGFNNVSLDLIDVLQEFADRTSSSIAISSACRCRDHNLDVGSNDDSMHRIGIAADLVTLNCSHDEAASIALEMFNEGKIGGLIIYRTFLHIDLRRKQYYKDKR